MDAVVLHSDIARLVLGYLKRQKLESTSRLFCKTSPHLKHEFTVYRSGFTPHSFCPDLEDIICEYVNIKHIVDRFVSSLTSSQRFELFELKLPEKVKLLLERSLATNSKTQQSENSTHNKNITKNNSNASSNINSDKENTANKHPKQKRKRDAVAYSSDERLSPFFLSSKNIKRRRILEPFCFISTKQQNLQRQRQTAQTPSTSGDQTEQTDDENEEDTLDEDSNEPENEEENGLHHNETDLSLLEKPTKESTPHSKSANGKFSTPSVPELSQAILDNPQFQMKLVDNINQALNNSKCGETRAEVSNPTASTSKMSVNENNLSEEQQIITSNEMLDQMVKDILKATEQDPAFDAIVENVVGASIQPANASAGVQCNINAAEAAPQQQLISMPAGFDHQQQQQQQQFTFVQQHQQAQLTLPTLSTISQQPTDSSTAPRTPLIIRTAISASNTSLNSGAGDAQILSTLTANNSFGSLIDPNFSISKLIVLNSNDSAQKEAPGGEQIIGNITADNLINHLTNVGDATGDEQQVFIDNATGQFVLLADEGILANFPFLLNGEGIIQQIQPAPAGQQPQNTVIVSSAQKVNAAEENEIEGKIVPCTACKKPQDATVPTSLQSRTTADSETPSGSGIVNMKAFKSLSTPRKRTSHVRTLSFSPKTTAGSQAAQKSSLRPNPIAEECEELANSADIPERPIIKNVEILPALGGPIDASANESSNSCSVPPLFVTEESSNQTVIKTELSLRETGVVEKTDKIDNKIKSAVSGLNADTPKRKQVRKTAVRACKRQLSKSSDESETKPAPTTEVEQNEESEKSASLSEPPAGEQRVENVKDDKMMEEWLRLRNASNRDLDSRLRQINAEQHAVLPKSVRRDKNTSVKRRSLRRKRQTISKRMRKKARQEAHTKALLAESEADASIVEDEPKEVVKPDIRIVEKSKRGKCTIESRRVSKDRNSKEFNIKIPTPQKDKRETLTKTKSESVESASTDKAGTNDDAVDGTAYAEPATQTADNTSVHVSEEHKEQERDRRTANIACLLDTPFKAPTLMDAIPPTPGKPVPSLDTPAAKLRTVDGDMQLSTSYLFGSLTKSELDTPQLSAITPGLRFTPFGSSRDVTPRSGTAPTDYSSGGSYYKPDESEDLDRNFEKLLRDSAQKQRQEEEERAKLLEQHLNAEEVKSALFEEPRQTVVDEREQAEAEAEKICVEIPAEKLRVEPIVLKRVKSFGAEGTESTEATSNIDPHYTLVSDLPEICAEGESSDSSSTASTSTSSSSSNSSTSSSSSSTNSSSTTDEEESATHEKETPTKNANLSLSLDNLSTISSTEDEEWQKLAVTEEENSQLVSNDGEVRYPVRSWLTPSKVDPQAAVETHEQAPATTIKVTVPLKSAEKKNRLEDDLQQKRERMMEKLKQDANQRRVKQPIATTTPSVSKSAALIASRKLVAMREKAKILPAKATMLPTNLEVSQVKLAVEVQEKRTMEVLTALQLSAKKQAPQFSSDSDAGKARKPITVPPMASLDDNATTTLFTQAPTAAVYELTEKTERLPLKTLISKVKAKQRQCEQIEALPALKRSRTTRVGRKKIVRKPLGFKGTNAPETVFEPDQLEEVKTPHKAMTKSVAEQEGSGGKDAVVSPVPRIRIKTPTGLTADRPSALRVSPRLLGNKKSRLKDGNADEKEDGKEDTSEEAVVSGKSKKPLKAAKSKAATTAKRLLATVTKKSPVRTRMTKSKRTAPTEVLQAKIILEEQKQDEDKVRDEQPSEKQKSAGEEILPVEHAKSDKSDSSEKVEKTKSEKKKYTEKKEKESKQLDKPTKASKKDKEAEKIKQTDRPTSAETKSGKHPVTETTVTAQKRKPIDNIETVDDKEDMTKQKTEATSRSKIIDDASITNENTKTQDATKEIQTRKDTRCEGHESNVDPLDENIQDQAIEKKKLTKENEAAEIAPKPEVLPTSTTNMETETADTAETSEEDPLEHCELTSVTDEDPVRFISVTYDGPDGAPANPLPRRDFTNFKMVVAFDEEEKHIWRISNEMVLFSASPASQQIRNIPKKRKVRINTCGSSDNDNITTVGVVHSTTTTSRQATNATVNSSEDRNQRENSSNEAKPVATSTPISAPATSSTEEPRRRTTITRNAVAGTEVASGSASAPPAEVAATSSAGPTDVLEIDDIESLLSRLHGKEN
ncbi:serine-rich adhesin for platelets isoform X3 [Bactrocera neohumeralis]|uniref:serine-rich adhesin for platelets isoform X3 n=1 Tax=Bactrocera neohumeralis TaxID=98809 RepID=UPI002165863E|nr:serine-rich adhesin for platelets isoform X3 [Bactrocera neohumeralis]